MPFEPGSLAQLVPPFLSVILFLACLSQIKSGLPVIPNWLLSVILLGTLIFGSLGVAVRAARYGGVKSDKIRGKNEE
jgi:hypothetical protein